MRAFFVDGPAQAKTLSIARTPVMLRVTYTHGFIERANTEESRMTTILDALDQPSDTIGPHETAFVYVLCDVQPDHVTYREYPRQPAQELIRDNARWSEWCESVKLHVFNLLDEWGSDRVLINMER